jgi:CHRD domain-containing protein
MKKRVLYVSLVAVVGLAIGSLALAETGKKEVSADPLSGYAEPPAVSTVASGSFDARIADDGNSFDWELSYADLEGTVTQAHVHFGQRSVNGGISVWLCSNLASPPTPPGVRPCPPPPATITGTATAADVTGPTSQGIAPGELAELVAAIRAGRAYANVHTTKFPGGEIRGQIEDADQRDS